MLQWRFSHSAAVGLWPHAIVEWVAIVPQWGFGLDAAVGEFSHSAAVGVAPQGHGRVSPLCSNGVFSQIVMVECLSTMPQQSAWPWCCSEVLAAVPCQLFGYHATVE